MYIALYKERKGGFGRGPYWILVIIFGLESTTEPMFEEEVQCTRRQWTEVGEGITCAYQRNRLTKPALQPSLVVRQIRLRAA